MRKGNILRRSLLFLVYTVNAFSQNANASHPAFSIVISEDKIPAQSQKGVHRLRVKITRVTSGSEVEQFHPEAESMYDMIVLRDGTPADEKDALRELKRYRALDTDTAIQNPRLLFQGENWQSSFDVSDYYDMSQQGTYEVTVTRREFPGQPSPGDTVRSNTIKIKVPEDSRGYSGTAEQKPRPRFALTVSAPDAGPGFLNIVRVSLQNISDSPIREAKCWPYMGMYKFLLFRNGNKVEPKAEWLKFDDSRATPECPGNETLNEIQPKEDDEVSLPISNFFDISIPGSYLLYATRETYPWNAAKSEIVQSNGFTFEVQPPPAVDRSSVIQH